MEKQNILDKLSKLPLYELDSMRDKKLLELRNTLNELHKIKDNELVVRHTKRKQLLAGGNSYNKTEQILRADEELYNLKRLVGEYSALKNKIKIELEIVTAYYWKQKQGG